MTAKQTLDKLRKLLEFKQSAAWTNLMYYEETYGEDSVEAKKARATWSEIHTIILAIDHPDELDERIAIWEDVND